MKSVSQWIHAATLLAVLPLSATARTERTGAAGKGVGGRGTGEIVIAGASISKPDSENRIVISGPGTGIALGEFNLKAEELVWDPRVQTATADGDIQFNFRALRILARGMRARMGDAGLGPSVSTGIFRMGFYPGYVEGDALRATRTPPATPWPALPSALEGAPPAKVATSRATLNDVTLYYCEPDFFSITVDAAQITYTVALPEGSDGIAATTGRDNATFQVRNAVVRVAGLPVFYLPFYTQTGFESPPLDATVRVGRERTVGDYLRTTTYYTGFGGEYQPGLILDLYRKAGVLVGPVFRYDATVDTGLAVDGGVRGNFQAAWINDNSLRGTDNYNAPIPAHRGFITWEHKHTVRGDGVFPRVELTSAFNYWSDTSVVRDFRPGIFDANQRPDNFLEIVLPNNACYLSLFARYRPNDFQNVQQRLPEIRLDLNPCELIPDSGIYQRASVAFAYLFERTSPELSVPGGTLDSTRLDAYYGLSRPVKIQDWLSFTPVAGVRATRYLYTADATSPYARVLPQLGFDLHLHAQGQWDYENVRWDIHGLRHQFRPLVQYRWIPAADKGREHLPAIDRYSFLPYPPPVDLAQKRYADDLWEQQVLRIGFENQIQTRDAQYGSRDLAWLNVYQDFRDTDRVGERVRSTTYTQLGLAPVHWLSLDVYHRLDTYNWTANEVSARLNIHDGDRWRLFFGTQYITDAADLMQYTWGLEYRLNSNYTLTGQWRYDSHADKLTEQFYGLRQRLGHTWELDYHFSYRQDARQNNGFSFGVALRMRRF
ncbi:MAG: hypothetical protein LBD14_06930 [Puniceicoccales bacterium]|nr:hypothetical protein [Puniceicoccales bacterium]